MIDLKDLEGVVWYGSFEADAYLEGIGVNQMRWRGYDDSVLYTVHKGEILQLGDRPLDKAYIYTEELRNASIVDIIEWAKSKEKPCPEEKSNPEEEPKYVLHKGGEVFIGTLKECQDIVKDNLWWEGADVYSKTGSVSISVSLQ